MTKKAWAASSAGLMILGSALPWATVRAGIFSRSVGGLEGDGQLTILLGVACLVLVLKPGTTTTLIAALAGLAAAAIGAIDYNNLTHNTESTVTVSPGLGIVALVAGGVGCCYFAFAMRGEIELATQATEPGTPLPPPSV